MSFFRFVFFRVYSPCIFFSSLALFFSLCEYVHIHFDETTSLVCCLCVSREEGGRRRFWMFACVFVCNNLLLLLFIQKSMNNYPSHLNHIDFQFSVSIFAHTNNYVGHIWSIFSLPKAHQSHSGVSPRCGVRHFEDNARELEVCPKSTYRQSLHFQSL